MVKIQAMIGGRLARKAVILITIFKRGDRRFFMAFLTAQTAKNPAPMAINKVKKPRGRNNGNKLPRNEIIPVITAAMIWSNHLVVINTFCCDRMHSGHR